MSRKQGRIGNPGNEVAKDAKAMGADEIFDVTATSGRTRHGRADLTCGDGADIVIEASGSARAVEEGPDLARNGGTYVIAGHYTNAGPSTINAHEQINRKHLDIRGCWGSEAGHFLRALRILERHSAHIPWRFIGARAYRLDELNDALADAEAMRIPKALVRPNEA